MAPNDTRAVHHDIVILPQWGAERKLFVANPRESTLRVDAMRHSMRNPTLSVTW